jgi:uncharacterized protein YjbI with pentapeptide repeats
MKTYTKEELREILNKHQLWLKNKEGGAKADLSYADLSYANLRSADLSSANLRSADLRSADLSSANLRSADLSSANLSSANLRYADLSSANLRYADLSCADLRYADLSCADLSSANLRYANLRYADLSYANYEDIYKDFMAKLALQKDEVIGLLKSVVDGKIDGSTYTGECACFVGTIAKVKGVNYESLNIKPGSESPTERFFLAIKKGDTPENNQISEIVACWIIEFLMENEMDIPQREVVWG